VGLATQEPKPEDKITTITTTNPCYAATKGGKVSINITTSDQVHEPLAQHDHLPRDLHSPRTTKQPKQPPPPLNAQFNKTTTIQHTSFSVLFSIFFHFSGFLVSRMPSNQPPPDPTSTVFNGGAFASTSNNATFWIRTSLSSKLVV